MGKVSLPLEGGCQCGSLRYSLSAPPLMIYCCHCANCQKIAGSAFVVSATVIETAFAFIKGAPAKTEWMSDVGNERYGWFCPDCGCRIAHGQTPSINILSLRAGTFDDTSWVEPVGHIWTKSAQDWFRFDEALLTCEGQPTDYGPYIKTYAAQERF